MVVEKDARIHGSCLCRAVAYAVSGRLGPMWHCHCLICRKLSGAAFTTHIEARASAFSWLRGQELLAYYALSSTLVRSFCRRCGDASPVAHDHGRPPPLCHRSILGSSCLRLSEADAD